MKQVRRRYGRAAYGLGAEGRMRRIRAFSIDMHDRVAPIATAYDARGRSVDYMSAKGATESELRAAVAKHWPDAKERRR